jgi:hypothetical protein
MTHSNYEKLPGAFLIILIDDFPILAQNRRRVLNDIQFERLNGLITNGKRKGQKKRENNDRQEK